MYTAIIKRDNASDKMESINPIIQQAVEVSIRELNNGLSHFSAKLRNGTKANLLYDIIKSNIRAALANLPNLEIQEKWGSLTIIIDSVLNAKIKKINNVTGLPSFGKTNAAKAFIDQSQLSLFPDSPAPTNICIGFKINDIFTELLELKVLCIHKEKQAWQPIDMMLEPFIESKTFISNEETVKHQTRVTKKAKRAN